MDFKLELVAIPVTDVDRAKAFYEAAGFNADHDHRVSDDLRFVQLTPPGFGVLDLHRRGDHPGRARLGEGDADGGRGRRGGPPATARRRGST